LLERISVRITDASTDELGLISPSRLDVGAIVQIRLQRTAILAEVRDAVRSAEGFKVGVRVHDVFEAPIRRRL
jgi:hypothetical protein